MVWHLVLKTGFTSISLGNMKSVVVFVAALLIGCGAFADGVALKDGRYVRAAMVMSLTHEQKQAIDHFRTCHLENFKSMNVYTPYIFELTRQQSQELSAKVGFAPRKFQVYETYRGFNDAGPHWNLALRFSDGEIEVPLDLLLSDEKAKKAHDEQGWKSFNPCFPKVEKQ